jgi:hypothetical protein
MNIVTPAAAVALAFLPTSVQAAATCEQFKEAMIKGATQYQAPAPKFRLDRNSSADPGERYFTISMFRDVRAAMSCSHGSVRFFLADANDREKMSHLMLMMAIGLHGYGIGLRPALELRDQLVRMAKESDAQSGKLPFDGGEASLVINIVGVPSFQIDTTN